MDTPASNQASTDNLKELLRDVSVMQASQYFDGSPVTLISHPADHQLGQVLARYITMVLLISEEIRIVFKVHFNPEQVAQYRLSKGCVPADVTDRNIVDFMKELSNQIGGRIYRVFNTHDISVGMSIPLCTRGIYEIYADYKAKTGAVTKFGDFWRLEGAFGFVYCSCYIELISKDDFSQIKCSDEQSQEGELDFL